MSAAVEATSWPESKVAATMTGIFVGSRLLAAVSGLGFDASFLATGWQHIDPVLMQTRLGESLFYLHAQPPFFNLLLGLAVKSAGAGAPRLLEVAFLAMGAALYAEVYALMRRLGVTQRNALWASSIFGVSPSFLLYEHWLFYTLPLAFLVGSAAWAFARSLDRRDAASCLLFFATVAALCATHGIFNLVYFVACIVLLLFVRGLPRRTVLATALAPFLLVFGLYAKNAVVFGQFGVSSWMGMNLAIRRLDALGVEERQELVAAGKLSDVALTTPFDPLDKYPAHYAEVPERFRDIPVLAAARKANHEPNLNHFGYIAIAHHYAEDTKFVVLHHPSVLVKSVLRGWYEYFKSSSDYWFLAPSLASSGLVRAANRAVDLALYGVLIPHTPGIFLTLATVLAVAGALRAAYRPRASDGVELTPERRFLLAFCAGTIAYVAVVANTLNAIENMRLRFMTDPLLAALIVFGIQNFIVFRWQRRHKAV